MSWLPITIEHDHSVEIGNGLDTRVLSRQLIYIFVEKMFPLNWWPLAATGEKCGILSEYCVSKHERLLKLRNNNNHCQELAVFIQIRINKMSKEAGNTVGVINQSILTPLKPASFLLMFFLITLYNASPLYSRRTCDLSDSNESYRKIFCSFLQIHTFNQNEFEEFLNHSVWKII